MVNTLTDEQVESARCMRKEGFEFKDIGIKFGVSRQTISRVLNGESKNKTCRICGNLFTSRRAKDCNECLPKRKREATQESARKNRNKYRDKCRNKKLKDTYGITLEEYDVIHAYQRGLCAICGQPETACYKYQGSVVVQRLAVDHNHETGKIRGLLCGRCNAGIGFFQDDAEKMRAACEYLNRNNG